MIKIYVKKKKGSDFCVVLPKRDARKFLKNFTGKKEVFDMPNVDADFNYLQTCTSPRGYSIEVFDMAKDPDTFDKAVDLMDGDWN